MTQEEKAKAYDKAIERAKRMFSEKELDYLFPELAESEDDRIRNSIIKHLQCDVDDMSKSDCPFDFEAEIEELSKYIAWLKKQGDLTIRFFTDEFELALGRIIAFWNQNHKNGKYDENELMSYIKVRETELVKLFTDNVCKISLSDCSEEYRKAYYDGYNKCNRDWLKIKDISVDEYNKNAEILLGGKVKQKPVDKVEPKFKVGNWIVDSQGLTHQIERVVENVTTHTFGYDIVGGGYFNDNNEDVHLWTIKDTKDGDVLAADECYVIFKEIDGLNIKCYCTYHYMGFNPSFHIDTLQNKTAFKPATKEQRDALFAAIKAEGYEWDAENKELKEIEEEYNGEDYGIDSLFHAQRILEKTLGKVDGYQTDDGILSHKCAITAIKKLYEQKPKWTEDDNLMIDSIIDTIERLEGKGATSMKDWLESLKRRIGEQQ